MFCMNNPSFSGHKCRPEAAGDAISGTAFGYVGTDVHASVGDYSLNTGRIIDSLFGRTRFAHFYEVFSNILQPTGSS